MKFLYISASNMVNVERGESTSYKICAIGKNRVQDKMSDGEHTILELRNYHLLPCIGCGKCLDSRRCILKDDFNAVYEQIIACDLLLIVSPHYAPIPPKLAALLERMEQITFLHWGGDNTYQSEVWGKATGVISHGGGGDWALKSYKLMVNDTVANALDTIQLRLVPFSDEWNTGISLPVCKVSFSEGTPFPVQEYDWKKLTRRINDYMDILIKHI